jgi:hypothetical protein
VMGLIQSDARRAALCAGLLASDNEGEVVNAARSLCMLLSRNGLDVATVLEAGLRQKLGSTFPLGASPQRPLRDRAQMFRCAPNLTAWERDFLASVVSRWQLTAAQEKTLRAIVRKAEAGGA